MRLLALAVLCVSTSVAHAQYNPQAGKNAPAAPAAGAPARDGDRSVGRVTALSQRQQPARIARDDYGNAKGSQYDLAVDGAFKGQTILVIDYYGGQYGIGFSPPRDAVKSKGFSVVHYNKEPSVKQLQKDLARANQFWVISSCDNTVHLSTAHQQAIQQFFEQGHGVYLWGDNDPCNADADALAKLLVDASVRGDLPGDRTVQISSGAGKPGIVQDHLLSTGVENVYEGITVATVTPTQAMTPVIYGSAGNLVAAAYEKDGKRLIVDGGFTRLSYKWDTAGTGRYLKNAAAWLANFERFGDKSRRFARAVTRR